MSNKQTAIKPFNISKKRGNESKREASIKCKANRSHDNTQVKVEKVSDMKDDDPKEKSSDDETGFSGSNPPGDEKSETSANHQPDKQDGVSNPMDYPPNKKELEEPPRIVVSNLGTNAGQSEGTKAPPRKKAGSDCLIQEKVQKTTEKTKESA